MATTALFLLFLIGASLARGVRPPAECTDDTSALLSVHERVTQARLMQDTFAQHWSHVRERKFPGGSFKYSNMKNFPGSHSMSASLIELDVGGIRGLHWHTEAEWAYVLSGVCRQALHIPACPCYTQQAGASPSTALLTHAAHSIIRLRPIAGIRVHACHAHSHSRRHRNSPGSDVSAASPDTALGGTGVL